MQELVVDTIPALRAKDQVRLHTCPQHMLSGAVMEHMNEYMMWQD